VSIEDSKPWGGATRAATAYEEKPSCSLWFGANRRRVSCGGREGER
jgi:hypothetical protein